MGRALEPVPPLNLVGDFGGGGLLLVAGILAALVERAASGRGQVVDAAMSEGASLLASMIWSYHNKGMWAAERQANIFDGEIFLAPRLNAPIDGEGIITGDWTREEIDDMIVILRSGRLPIHLRLEAE